MKRPQSGQQVVERTGLNHLLGEREAEWLAGRPFLTGLAHVCVAFLPAAGVDGAHFVDGKCRIPKMLSGRPGALDSGVWPVERVPWDLDPQASGGAGWGWASGWSGLGAEALGPG